MNYIEKNDIPSIQQKFDTDIIAITCFFNPSKYKSKKINFVKFRNNLLIQKVPLIVVECSLHDSPYEINIDDADLIVRVKSNSRIWQKERLLNIAIEHIPKGFTKFVSLDCDILFKNNNWLKETSLLLDKFPVVQPFTYSLRLKKGESDANYPTIIGSGNGQRIHSFAKGMIDIGKRDPTFYSGHTGFAWAFRLDSFNYFYDKLIIGGGDHFIAYALYGLHHIKQYSTISMIKDQQQYIKSLSSINGNVSYTSGIVHHLWHGSRHNRHYHDRVKILEQFNFNPNDLVMNKSKCWETSTELEIAICRYFDSRKEDE